MRLTGTIRNGKVELDEAASLPDGTRVTVEAASGSNGHAAALDEFWHRHTLNDLIQQQVIPRSKSVDELMGGWPSDQVNDEFDQVLREWRNAERSA